MNFEAICLPGSRLKSIFSSLVLSCQDQDSLLVKRRNDNHSLGITHVGFKNELLSDFIVESAIASFKQAYILQLKD